MLRYQRASCLLVLALFMIALAGCGGSEFRKTEKYYLVATNTDLPYWQAAKAGLVSAAVEIGVAAEMVGPDTYDPAAQKQAFDDLLAVPDEDLPAGILISPSDPDVLTPVINSAVAKGINVITIDSDAPESDRLTFVGTDNYSVGVQSAEITAEQLQNAGNVIVFTIEGQANLEDRLRGYKDIFAQFPAIRIIDVVDIKGEGAAAFDLTKEILAERRSSVDAFVCLESIACPEVAEVLNRSNARDKIVIAMDTPVRTLDWVQHGLIQATIAQKPYTMAYSGVRMLADLYKYKPERIERTSSLATLPYFVNTGSSIVTRDNVERYLQDQAKVQPLEAEATGVE